MALIVKGETKTISKEMGVKNLRVNAVLPGLTDTKMAKK